MTSSALSYQLKARTKEEFGTAINPHSFRHMAATTIATVDPENATFIAAILGHSSAGSSDRHYNRARTIDSGRRYQALITAARQR
jgi:integrase